VCSSGLTCLDGVGGAEVEAQSRGFQAIIEKSVAAMGGAFSLSESESLDLKREMVGEEGLG
jgi:hypothetical protein